ncbi:beta-glucosidase [Luteitalea sp. TBR-22]|uniref:family 1 glycosylhydrolase n=1 Tax=Luteitalea sp. TBR-22 TaxID=2802971 RepID=UPI001AF46928|nr:family 1 glycosylhydrolase [Luteitalea sp. TBR-22]BCS31922.1 beta-glucosidase [Luteitalea sp. TBR-22]
MSTPLTFLPSLFDSFWLAGFESACHVTRAGRRLDMLAATQHDRFVDEDYARLEQVRIGTVRDTIRWHRVEPSPGRFDFASVAPYLQAARANDLQVVWDLLHYGVPDDVDVFAPSFVDRFAGFARASARFIREHGDEVPFYTPINELSFYAWAAADVGWFHPHAHGRGAEFKRQLVRAWIAAVDAIRDVDPRARLVSVEPLIHVVPPLGQPDEGGRAAAMREGQFEAWDLIAGVREPALGGAAHYLDVIGVNFYHDNQWEEPGGRRLHWHVHPRDARWQPLHRLLQEVHARFGRPLIIGETSHVGVGRAEWIAEITDEVVRALTAGVPIEGICLYPIIDRFEWDDPTHWHNSGLWDFVHQADGAYTRVLNEPYAQELRRCQLRLAAMGCGTVEPSSVTA